ncbi:MAG: YifB family Mg chelatase-like AAA ATPase [Candidatus Paceibacterota bacterium]
MSIAKCYSAHLAGLLVEIVTVEIDISNGLNSLSIVGLGDRAVEEAKDRVSAAVKNSGYISPKQKNQKVIISLAPADVRKEGPAFDLAIALSYLSACGELTFRYEKVLFLGELSLEGEVRRVSGILPILCQARNLGFDTVFVPHANAEEASLAKGIDIYAVSSLSETVRFLKEGHGLQPIEPLDYEAVCRQAGAANHKDMRLIRGNEGAKRALTIAAAGAHNILMYGPPGTGKTMLAQSFSSILPALSYEQAVEVTSLHSAARVLGGTFMTKPPFRAPHHTASYPSIVGGGSFPKPGEITLAHRGVLFLDELPEFDHNVLEALRQPLEEREITISRARGAVTFPAQCILVASMNPCPCGKPRNRGCTCSAKILQQYRRRISGPIMDRLDIWTNVNKIDYAKLSQQTAESETSSSVKARVIAARTIQVDRFRRWGVKKSYNGEMDARDIERMIDMSAETRNILAQSAKRLVLSGRAFHRVIKVARTIADLDGVEIITKPHILEALQYRQKIE